MGLVCSRRRCPHQHSERFACHPAIWPPTKHVPSSVALQMWPVVLSYDQIWFEAPHGLAMPASEYYGSSSCPKAVKQLLRLLSSPSR